ncbi:POX domain, partial [Dillenia turbinata]
ICLIKKYIYMASESGDQEKSTNIVSTTKSGLCYSDVSPNNNNLIKQIQTTFEPNTTPSEIYTHLSSSNMDMINANTVMWKGFFNKINPHPSSSSNPKADFYQQPEYETTTPSDNHLMVTADSSPTAWQDHESSLRCVFPCEGNERPSQGLSLSLSSNNPSSIGLQSFELRDATTKDDDMNFISSNVRSDGLFFGKSEYIPQQEMITQDGYLGGKGGNFQQAQFHLRSCKYLGPAQELLNEFCNLGTRQIDPHKSKGKTANNNQWESVENENGSASSSRNKSLQSLELIELQKRKTKLLAMLEEVDRRYRHYCDQMKAVVSSFEAVAGNGAATVYSALASKAMSRHFRCLRDGIVSQIQATKKAMGEKDPVARGTTRGETPRLRLLDQAIRRQRAFQQMSMMEAHPWRPQRGLPERSVSVLRAWLFEHFLHPYPSDVDKHILARQTGLSRSQAYLIYIINEEFLVSNWFINARVRLWKPMVEEMYVEETKETDNITTTTSDGVNPSSLKDTVGRDQEQKPTSDQLVRIESECLSSIINNPEKSNTKATSKTMQAHLHHQHHQSFGRVNADAFGAMELDFTSYNHHSAAGGGVSYASEGHAHQNFGGNVSLTLGLQQHGGSGVNLAFSPASHNSLFFTRDHIEDCQPVQYSLLESEAQNLPYRNLMGAQLLRDLAG